MGVSSRLTLPLHQADGNIRQVAWSITPHPSGESFFAIGRDTTDVVAARQRLREAEERLAQMQQMETLGQLAGGVAHDFNNLLVPILNVLDLLQRRPQGDSDFDELICGASRAALSARTLVRRMLYFAQRQKSEPETVDVAKLISGMEDLLTHILPQAVQLEIDACEEMAPVKIHPNQLELSILNLAMNASDAMRGSGKLRIRAESAGAEGIAITVTDTGIGMDEETVGRATDAFFTTKGPGKGTGLGLFMAKRLAEKANGTLDIRSIVGEGTEIRFWLPAVRETSATEGRLKTPDIL